MASTRRLVAIMFTDMVGFTSATHSDEAGSLRLLREQDKLLRPLLEAHRGRKVKAMGDGLLIEFRNALDAIQCAVEFQQAAQKVGPGTEPGPLRLRIGIHLGDVQRRDGDILGDAVNIAARIEPLAEVGGICLSAEVFNQVHNKVPFQFERLPPQNLKGIPGSPELYRVVLPWTAMASLGPDTTLPRLAVLPFANMSPDPGDAFFADGLTEELILRLSGLPELRVIARTSVMKYRDESKGISEIARELRVGQILEGSVRKSGARLRITVQLIDTHSQEHLWSQQYDRELNEIFAVQTEISNEVVAALRLRVGRSMAVDASAPPGSTAYTTYLRARHLFNQRTSVSTRTALDLFSRAAREDEKFARAYAGIADCNVRLVGMDQIPDSEGMPAASEFANRALQLDELLPEAHVSRGTVDYYQLDLVSAERHLRRAIELQPSLASAHAVYSALLTSQGRLPEAVREAELAEESDPVASARPGWLGYLKWVGGDGDGALQKWAQAIELEPVSGARFYRMEYRALAGDVEAARADLEALCEGAEPSTRHWVPLYRAHLEAIIGSRKEAEAHLAEYVAGSTGICSHRFCAPSVLALLGDVDAAFAALGDPSEHRMGEWELIFRTHPAYGRFREDPRFVLYSRPWDPPPDTGKARAS